MSCTNTPLHNELLGAVIGLARTCANNPKTDDTDRLIFTALRVSANKSANEQTLAEKLMQTKSEEIPEGTIPRLYHALFMVKEDWDAKPLQELAEDIASL